MHCPHCGRDAQREHRFCSHCGHSLRSESVQDASSTWSVGDDSGGAGRSPQEPSESTSLARTRPMTLHLAGGSVVAERFRIDAILGRGGFGCVYRAWDEKLHRLVALKTIPLGGSSLRFEREAQALAALNHPSIVTIFDTGIEEQLGWIAMELIEGRSLAESYKDGPIPWDRLSEVFRQVAAALAHAHDRGIVHRDVKPANVIVGSKLRTTMTDFGIARALGDTPITDSGSVFGTLHYLAPELLEEAEPHPGSDIYSLGVCFFEGLTGKLPVRGSSAETIIRNVLRHDHPSLHEDLAGMPADLRELVIRCLAREPGERPQSALEVMTVLERLLRLDADTDSTSVRIPLRLSTRVLRPEIEGERKKVAVLMIHERHVEDLLEEIPLEQVMAMREQYLEDVFQVIGKHGGRVERVDSDCVIAVFGLPYTTESDEGNALRCAAALRELPIQDHLGDVEPRLSFAVHTGHALGSPGADSYLIRADTLRLTRRLEEHARTGDILLSGTVRNAAADTYRYEPLGELVLPGEDHGLQTYRVAGSAEGAARPTGIVGREAELALLRQNARKAMAGQGQIVGVTGEAGVGKTRLVETLLGELREGALGEEPEIRVVAGVSAGGAFPYRTLGELVGSLGEWTGVAALDGSQRAALRALRPDQGDAAGEEGDLDPASVRRVLATVVRKLLAAACSDGPLVLVLEDLHWFDTPSLEVVRDALGESQGLPLLCIVAYRPGFDPGLGSHRNHHLISLGTLLPEEDLELARVFLEVQEVPDSLRELLEERSEGNPLYVLEFLRMMEDKGLLRHEGDTVELVRRPEETEIPVSIEGILAARVDRLEPETRRLLQMASVLGREFPLLVLEEMWRRPSEPYDCLETLARRGILQSWGAGKEARLRFDHPLTRDVVYANILRGTRRRYHRWAARSLEELYGTGEGADLDLLAWHWGQSDRRDRAFDMIQRAAEWNRKAYRNEAALAQYDEALGLHPEPDETRARLLLDRGKLLEHVGRNEDAIRDGLEALEILARTDCREGREEVLRHLGRAYRSEGDFQEARRFYQQAIAVSSPGSEHQIGALLELSYVINVLDGAEKALGELEGVREKISSESPRLRAEYHLQRGMFLFELGGAEEAVAQLDRSMSIYDELGDRRETARVRYKKGVMRLPPGRYEEGLSDLNAALRENRELGNSRETAYCLLAIAYAHMHQGRLDAALEALHEMDESCEGLSFPWHRADRLRYGAQIDLLRGSLGQALDAARRARAMKEETGDTHDVNECDILLARIDWTLGRTQEAIQLARTVLNYATARGEPFQECEGRILLAETLAESGDGAGAREEAQRALEIARRYSEPETLCPALLIHLRLQGPARDDALLEEVLGIAETCGRKLDVARARILRGWSMLGRNRWSEGLKEAARARTIAAEARVPSLIWESYRLEVRGLRGLDKGREAEEADAKAGEFLEGMAHSIRDEELRNSYLARMRSRNAVSDAQGIE